MPSQVCIPNSVSIMYLPVHDVFVCSCRMLIPTLKVVSYCTRYVILACWRAFALVSSILLPQSSDEFRDCPSPQKVVLFVWKTTFSPICRWLHPHISRRSKCCMRKRHLWYLNILRRIFSSPHLEFERDSAVQHKLGVLNGRIHVASCYVLIDFVGNLTKCGFMSQGASHERADLWVVSPWGGDQPLQPCSSKMPPSQVWGMHDPLSQWPVGGAVARFFHCARSWCTLRPHRDA